jgi:UDP-glucose:(heptosyl)LPS alpha-1,3-glucosyltransferase
MGRLEQQLVGDPGLTCLAVSRMVAREFDEYYRRTQGVRVVYNAVDVPDPAGEARSDARQRQRFRLGLEPDDCAFITVAKNFALKGVAESIVAFARWFHARRGGGDARLLVVGRESPEGYQRHAGLRDVGRQVQFVPHTDDVFQWYAAADACILLSWYDPCSRVVLEATRWGIPSITTRFNGAAEILEDGAGIVVESPRETAAIVAAMEELADADARAARREACMRIADGLSIERHVDELLEAYAAAGRKAR